MLQARVRHSRPLSAPGPRPELAVADSDGSGRGAVARAAPRRPRPRRHSQAAKPCHGSDESSRAAFGHAVAPSGTERRAWRPAPCLPALLGWPRIWCRARMRDPGQMLITVSDRRHNLDVSDAIILLVFLASRRAESIRRTAHRPQADALGFLCRRCALRWKRPARVPVLVGLKVALANAVVCAVGSRRPRQPCSSVSAWLTWVLGCFLRSWHVGPDFWGGPVVLGLRKMSSTASDPKLTIILLLYVLVGSGPRYQILSHIFARCTSQNTHGHARITR